MTRVVKGIYDKVELDTGFFISDRDADLLCDWLGSYSDALEKAWQRANPNGNPRAAKHTKVRSFITAVARLRKGGETGLVS